MILKIVIAGGRDFKDYKLLEERCDYYLSSAVANGYIIKIVCGCANGADKLGERYAKTRGYETIYYPADWDRFKNRAGYLRNEEMAKVGDALIAFWDNESRGTNHMINLAKKYNLHIRVVNY